MVQSYTVGILFTPVHRTTCFERVPYGNSVTVPTKNIRYDQTVKRKIADTDLAEQSL